MDRHRQPRIVARVVSEFREMPGLCLTAHQAARLWGMDTGRCLRLLRRLVAIGVLRPLSRGRFACA